MRPAVVERIRNITQDPALVAETVRQARQQRDELIARLKAEALGPKRELRGIEATLQRVGARAPRWAKAGATAHLADVQARVEAIRVRLLAFPGEINVAKRVALDEHATRTAHHARVSCPRRPGGGQS